jgi:hypothetical protein
MTDAHVDAGIGDDRAQFAEALGRYRAKRNVSARVRALLDLIDDARRAGLSYSDIAKALAEIGITRQDGEALKGDQLRVIVQREKKKANQDAVVGRLTGGGDSHVGTAPGNGDRDRAARSLRGQDTDEGNANTGGVPHISKLLGDETTPSPDT